MKAVLCKEYGLPDSLVLEEVEPLKPGRGDGVISVKACSVNFPDTLIIQGKLKPHISGIYPLERAADALNEMMQRKVKGKVVLVTDQQ